MMSHVVLEKTTKNVRKYREHKVLQTEKRRNLLSIRIKLSN